MKWAMSPPYPFPHYILFSIENFSQIIFPKIIFYIMKWWIKNILSSTTFWYCICMCLYFYKICKIAIKKLNKTNWHTQKKKMEEPKLIAAFENILQTTQNCFSPTWKLFLWWKISHHKRKKENQKIICQIYHNPTCSAN